VAKKTSTTPRGVAGYTHLNEPDTKFNDAGIYSVKLALSAADAEPLIESLTALQQEAFKQAKIDVPIAAKAKGKKAKVVKLASDNPWCELDNGDFEFNFKMKASGISKKTGKVWTRTPAIFDIHGVALKNVPNIGAGSVLRVAYTAEGFYTALVGAGVSLRLEGVKVINLVEFGGASAAALGLDSEEEDVEDGFEASEEHLTAKPRAAAAQAEADPEFEDDAAEEGDDEDPEL